MADEANLDSREEMTDLSWDLSEEMFEENEKSSDVNEENISC